MSALVGNKGYLPLGSIISWEYNFWTTFHGHMFRWHSCFVDTSSCNILSTFFFSRRIGLNYWLYYVSWKHNVLQRNHPGGSNRAETKLQALILGFQTNQAMRVHLSLCFTRSWESRVRPCTMPHQNHQGFGELGYYPDAGNGGDVRGKTLSTRHCDISVEMFQCRGNNLSLKCSTNYCHCYL